MMNEKECTVTPDSEPEWYVGNLTQDLAALVIEESWTNEPSVWDKV